MLRTYAINDRARVRVGYPDGHIEVEVDLPFPLSTLMSTATRSFSAEEVLTTIPAMRHAIDAAKQALGIRRR